MTHQIWNKEAEKILMSLEGYGDHGEFFDEAKVPEALIQLTKLVDRVVVGKNEKLENFGEWYAKTKPYGGSREEYNKLAAIINNDNNFRATQRTILYGDRK